MAKEFKIELIGADELLAILAKAGARAIPAVKQAVTEEAQIIFRDSQRIVPVDTGTLRASGQILPAKEVGNGVEIVFGYGGAASAYALRQHENLSYNHKEGKQAKYLEEPLMARKSNFRQNLLKRVERILS